MLVALVFGIRLVRLDFELVVDARQRLVARVEVAQVHVRIGAAFHARG